MQPTDFERMAGRYDRGRAAPIGWLHGWRDLVGSHLPSVSGLRLLDLGAGTGLFAAAFVEWFDVDVVAVEPAAAMRREGLHSRPHPRIHWLAGHAERLPLADDTCHVAWLSAVVHHIADLTACATELRRVLRPASPVLFRSAFADRIDGVPWLRFFPEARPLAEARWLAVAAVQAAFRPAGFHAREVVEVPAVSAMNLREYADRVRVRADSTLVELPDDLFARGMTRLDQQAAVAPDEPVVTRLTLLAMA